MAAAPGWQDDDPTSLITTIYPVDPRMYEPGPAPADPATSHCRSCTCATACTSMMTTTTIVRPSPRAATGGDRIRLEREVTRLGALNELRRRERDEARVALDELRSHDY